MCLPLPLTLLLPSPLWSAGHPTYIPVGVWALKQPMCSHLHKNSNQTVDYMALGFMSFLRGVDIMRGIGRVLLKVEPVLGPEIARA